MLFRTFDGDLRLAVHRPNITPLERAVFLSVREGTDGLELVTQMEPASAPPISVR